MTVSMPSCTLLGLRISKKKQCMNPTFIRLIVAILDLVYLTNVMETAVLVQPTKHHIYIGVEDKT